MPQLASMLSDLRFAMRQLRRSPGFAFTGVLTLALGIAAACVMFSLVSSMLLEPLPYPEPDRLVGINLDQPGGPAGAAQTGETAQFVMDHAGSFSSFGLADRGAATDANFSVGNGHPLSLPAMHVNAGYFPTLGVAPLLGRGFTAAEAAPGGGRTVLLSDRLWHSALGGDPGVIGRVVRIDGDPATVIGVMPASAATTDAPDLWQPLQMLPKDPGYQGTNYEFIARLRPGVSLAQAEAEMKTLSVALLRAIPQLRSWDQAGPPVGESLWPLQAVFAAEARPGILGLSVAVLAVLLVACLNLAALMTARAAARQNELALRSTLGADRRSLLRLILGESLLLAVAGGLLGLLVAYAALPVLLHYAPLQLPKLHTPAIGGRTALFALGAGAGAVVLFGLLPALGSLRGLPSVGLGSARTASGSVPRQRLGKALLVAQVALATLLLAVGSALLGTCTRLRAATSGLRPQHLEVVQVQLKGQRYLSAAHTRQFLQLALERLAAIPGVGSASAVYGVPLDRGLNNSAGPADRPDLIQYAETRFVTPGYFATVGTPLLRGADFPATTRADAQPVALINEFAAKRWFQDPADALDRTVIDGGDARRRVLGVVAPVHLGSLADSQAPTVYLPIAQMDDKTAAMVNGWFPVSFVLRLRPLGQGDPDITHAAAAAISVTDADLAISKAVEMQSFVDQSYAAPRFFSWLAGGFAGFGLLLTVIGLFGLLSYQVASRTREIGVRMAVGANRAQVALLIVRRGMFLTALGLVAGLGVSLLLQGALLRFVAGALAVTTVEAGTVFANPTRVLILTAFTMLLTAVLASLLPASRAARIEPTEALRAE